MNQTKNGRPWLRAGLVVLLLVIIGGMVPIFIRDHSAKAEAGKQQSRTAPQHSAISVNAIHPRLDKNFQMTVTQPTDLQAYYRADIEARVPGMVKWIRVAPGSWVEKDQSLVKLDVPDLVADKEAKANVVGQRTTEWELAKERVGAAEAAVDTAKANVAEKQSLLQQAAARKKYTEANYKRLAALRASNSVEQPVVDVAIRDDEYAAASQVAAKAAIEKARSEVADATANLQVARADVKQKQQLIAVAKADLDRTAALLDYANVRAPFRGVVVRRRVDPGSFVQNASTGHPTPVLSLQRSDIVTAVMRLPDNYANYITPGTEAIIRLDTLPGVTIRGKVTRFAPTLETEAHDRTMLVEVDLWNGTAAEFAAFKNDPKNLEDLKEGPLPLVPQFTGKEIEGHPQHLLPGMYGTMTLILRNFGETYLIPSPAIVRAAGRPMIYVVQDGKAHPVPVKVILDDGTLAKVELLNDQGHVIGDLTGKEEIVVSNQEELSDGQAVRPTLLTDWKAAGTPAVPH